jgi:uncharacterized RDD family membrane protein YckC
MEKEILDIDLLDDSISIVPAAQGKRFANYLIDTLVCVVFILLLSVLVVIVFPNIPIEDDLLMNLSFYLLYVLYFTVLESSTKGKTPGKYITKTRVVNSDGTAPSFKTCLLRSLSRLVPFEAFSFLGSTGIGWHDRWTETYVVDERQSVLPQSQFGV